MPMTPKSSTPKNLTPHRLHNALSRVTDQASFIQDLLIEALGWDIPEDAERVADLGYDWGLGDDLGLSPDDWRNLL